jgi:preprotein translocase subunit Sss1
MDKADWAMVAFTAFLAAIPLGIVGFVLYLAYRLVDALALWLGR